MRRLVTDTLSFLKFPEVSIRLRGIAGYNNVKVLCLHRIHTSVNPFWNPIKPILFEKLLEYLKANYKILRFSDLPSYNAGIKPAVVLSFDDGYKDFLEIALPLLEKHNVPSNHNIVVQCASENKPIWTQLLVDHFTWMYKRSWVGSLPLDKGRELQFDKKTDYQKRFIEILHFLFSLSQSRREELLQQWQGENRCQYHEHNYMNWDDLRVCIDRGVDIGCHTWSHDVLSLETRVPILTKELADSKHEIEFQIGKEVSIIAMPNGQINNTVEKFIWDCGYKRILLANGKSGYNINSGIFDRLNLIQESWPEMKLRIAGFHDSMRDLLLK